MTETKTKVRIEYPTVVLQMRPAMEMNEEQFFEFCQLNRDWRIARSAEGKLEIMPPTGWATSDRNSEINMQLRLWAKRDGSGVASESSGGFILPNGAMRSPDAAWISRERLADLTTEQKRRFLPLCPDFVIELRSPSDPLSPIEAKMREYVENGTRLGWLIDPEDHKAHIYRPNKPTKILDKPKRISGDPVLSGFVLELKPIWEPGF
ncbi:MAG: Uma2 family endonuclease [Actinomycetota bacterium]|nr:Uma2 family endonuclease [Actinomycetota bacterium]